ncbi:MAG: hypothetical protein AB8F94_19200 [Saprospiraceae bacterium]
MSEKELINFGILNGWLTAIGRVNDKTNNGHHFELYKFEKEDDINKVIKEIFSEKANTINIEEKLNPEKILREKVNFWFFNYQPNKFSNPQFLEDKRGDFSLYDEDYKKEWIIEFVKILTSTTEMKRLFEVKLSETKKHYCNMSDDLIIEGNSKIFHLHFCLTD